MTNTSSIAGGGQAEATGDPEQAAGAAELAELLACLSAAERQMSRAVLLAGRLAGSGASERVEGLPLELLVGLAGRQTGADRRALVAAGEALAAMPRTAGLLAAGRLSWGQARAVARAARGMTTAQRDWLGACQVVCVRAWP